MLRNILHTCLKPNVTRVQSAAEWTASVHTLHMSKPNVTRVLGAAEWTASVHTSHMFKPNVARVLSVTAWNSLYTLVPGPSKIPSRPSYLQRVGPLKISLKVSFEGIFEGLHL